ncbi:MAG: Fe2+-dependent dioxygenase [Burkholderiales bacterium]|nr:Fe2+-dependent dioxygenase [Burkholderiales bacterium]
MKLTFPLLDASEVRDARALLHAAPWADGRTSAGVQAAQVKNNRQLPSDCEAARILQALVLQALHRSPRFLSAALPRKVFPPHFNSYTGTANSFGIHVDNAVRYTPAGVQVRTDLSCTVFLSEPDDYQGGELVVHDEQGGQRVKLPAGHALLYPGASVHEVLPVTRGERLAAFFWVESLVRGNDERSLLLALDTALVSLRGRDGESAEAVALTGVYHNLLRLWATT